MMRNLISLVSGVVFAIGLSISGMTRPGKVVGFLDVTDHWDPSLLFVMGGAVCFNFVAFRLIFKRKAPLFGEGFSQALKKSIDAKLILGAILFGVGWGLSGYCPGPVLVSIGQAKTDVWIVFGTMLLGMFVARNTVKGVT